MGDGIIVVEEVLGGAGGLRIIDKGLGLEAVGFGELVSHPEGELGFAGAGLPGQQQRAFEHVGDFEGIEKAGGREVFGRPVVDGQVLELNHRCAYDGQFKEFVPAD